jgi:lipopolysaccharide export system protein LptC
MTACAPASHDGPAADENRAVSIVREEVPIGRGAAPAQPDRAERASFSGTVPMPSDRYSRWVALLKRLLPAIGVGLLLFAAVWPRLGPLLDQVRRAFPTINLSAARELTMVDPRYAGIDRLQRPFVVTAATARQVPDRTNLMSLEKPRARMRMRSGAVLVLYSRTGIYQSQAQLLDLFTDVNLVRQDGSHFLTQEAHLNLATNTGDGHDPVKGWGPSGDITAQGFRIVDRGDTIVFTGRSHLLLKSAKHDTPAPPPPSLPATVARNAAAVAAMARPSARRPSARRLAPHHVVTRRVAARREVSRREVSRHEAIRHAGRVRHPTARHPVRRRPAREREEARQ